MPTGDPFKKVRPGDRLRIPSTAYNAFIDAALDLRARRQSGTPESTPAVRQAGLVLVKNCTGQNRERFDVLGVADPIFLPQENEQSFTNKVMFDGVIPVDPDHRGRFVILLEPLKLGSIGMACIDGVCPAWVSLPQVSDGSDDSGAQESPQYADIADGDAGTLLADAASGGGGAQILWIDPIVEPGQSGWAIVRLGATASGLTLLHGKLTEDWNTTTRPNWVLVQPCDPEGNEYLDQPVNKVYLLHPHNTARLSLQQLVLKAGLVLAYLPEPGRDEDDRPTGVALPLVRSFLFGKVVLPPDPGSNHVMVTVVDAQGNDLGYPEPIKCWLSTPTSNAGISADLQAGDVIWIDTPQGSADTNAPEAMAINVPMSDHKVLVNDDDDKPGFLDQKLHGRDPFITTQVVDVDTGKALEIRHIGPASYATTVDYLGRAGELLDLVMVDAQGTLLIRQMGFDAAGHFTWEGDWVELSDFVDEKVKASINDPTSGYLHDKLIGDETWISTSLDGDSVVVIDHVGPGPMTTSVAIKGNDEWIVGGADNAIQLDDKGHAFASAVLLTHGGNGIAGVLNASGDDWIMVDAELETDAKGHVIALQPLTVLHGGPGVAVTQNLLSNLAWDGPSQTLHATYSQVITDARGHVTSLAEVYGVAIPLPVLDEKVKASATDPTSGYLRDKLDGDGTWLSASLDGAGLVVIDHIGPGPMTISVAVKGNDAWIMGGADNAIQIDDKGHVYASNVLLTHGGNGIAHLVNSAGDNWITVDWECETDERGHVIALQDLTVLHAGGGIATTLDITGGDAWIVGTGQLISDERGHVMASSNATLTHGGSGISVNRSGTGDAWIDVNWALATDARGHVTAATDLNVAHGGPGIATTFEVSGDPWINGSGNLSTDARGHATSSSSANLSHGDPVAGATQPTVSAAYDPATFTLTITPMELSVDTKGHVITSAGAPIVMSPIGSDSNLVGDEEWITIENVAGIKTIRHIGDGLACTMTVAGDTWIAVDGLVESDDRGHVTNIHPLSVTHMGPGTAEAPIDLGGDDWININGSTSGTVLSLDAKGHGLSPDSGPQITHAGPGALASTVPVVGALGVTGTKLQLQRTDIGVDAKGHVTGGVSAGSPSEVDLVAVTVITDVRVSGTALEKKTRTLYVLKADAESGWTNFHTGTTCP